MKKKFLLLSVLPLLAMSSLTSCDALKRRGNGSKVQLNISCFDGGYGIGWLEEMADVFETIYPDVKVNIKTFLNYSNIEAMLSANIYECDLLVSITNNTYGGVKGYFLPINDVLESKASENETQTIAEKMGIIADSEYIDFNNEQNAYQIPVHLGTTGIYYNKSSLDEIYPGGYTLPVTTDEMLAMMDDIKTKEIGWGHVYTTSTDAEYAIYLRDILQAQYMGLEAFNNYYDGKYEKDGQYIFADDMTDMVNKWHDARMSSLQFLSTIYNLDNGYAPRSLKQMDFSLAQAYFWGVTSKPDYKPTAFMINGDWLYNEVEYLQEYKVRDIRPMRAPINSALTNLLSSISDDAQLAECVRYIDNVLEGKEVSKPSYLSDADLQRLTEARTMVWTTHNQSTASIPFNSRCPDEAKDFLRFIASDDGCSVYSTNLQGKSSLYNKDISNASKQNEYTKALNKISKNMIAITQRNTVLSCIGGLSLFGYLYFSKDLCNGVTAESIVQKYESEIINAWPEMKIKCGYGN